MNLFHKCTSWLIFSWLLVTAFLPGAGGVENWLCLGGDGHIEFKDRPGETCRAPSDPHHQHADNPAFVSPGHVHCCLEHDHSCIDLPMGSLKYAPIEKTEGSAFLQRVPAVYGCTFREERDPVRIDVWIREHDPGGFLDTVVLII